MIIRDALKLLATLLVFAFFTLVALELTLRVYLFGIAGLSPAKVNSFRNIFDSGLVQPADNLEVWYELKPNLNTLFRGAPLITNSRGLADIEYELGKPPNTYRVAVVGSSWTMGAGVALDDIFHSVLEREFNERSDDLRYEFINFGVESYGFGEMLGTIRHKVLAYDPDMILLVVTGSTPAFVWKAHDTPFEPFPVTDTRWNSYALIKLRGILGLKSADDQATAPLRETLAKDDNQTYAKQFLRAFDELESVCDANGIQAASVWLRIGGSANWRAVKMFDDRAAARNIAGSVIDVDAHLLPGEPVHKILVNRVEKHPNARGHEIIAREIYEGVFGGKLPVSGDQAIQEDGIPERSTRLSLR